MRVPLKYFRQELNICSKKVDSEMLLEYSKIKKRKLSKSAVCSKLLMQSVRNQLPGSLYRKYCIFSKLIHHGYHFTK